MKTAKDILSDLVSFGVLGGQSNSSIASYIEKYLLEYGIQFTNVHDLHEDKRSIHCRIGPATDGGVILSGHMDVVPVDGQDWHTDPFTLADGNDGKLYGRGTCDMKGFLACCLSMVPYFKAQNLQKPIYFAFSYDEEIGCLAGPALAADINRHYTENPKYAIIGEPSLMQPMLGHKGIVIYKTSVHGSEGHSSRVMQDVSAIYEAAKLIVWLEHKMVSLIENKIIDKRFIPPHTTIHCGLIDKSGIAPNVICDLCSFTWDVRVIPLDIAAEIRADFDDHCSQVEDKLKTRFKNFKISTTEVHADVPPLDTPASLDVVSWIKKISGNSTTSTVSYAAEAGQFSEAGFQTVICGPGSIAQAHRANEFIDSEQLNLCCEMLRRIAEDFVD